MVLWGNGIEGKKRRREKREGEKEEKEERCSHRGNLVDRVIGKCMGNLYGLRIESEDEDERRGA